MNLIDRYVSEVSDRLPEKMRDDLSKEIRSLIEDTLEDRAKETGKAVTDEGLVTEVLKGFGSPEKMAASYLPPRYLIGPRLYPIFWLVLRIVLGIVAIVFVVQLGVTLAATASSFTDGLGIFIRSLIQFMWVVLVTLGKVVFIFAIIEWLMPKISREKEKAWDPRSMDSHREKDKISLTESIAGIVFTFIVILLFNFYPQWVGVGTFIDDRFTMMPMLTDAFFKFLPALNIIWVLELVKGAILIRESKWTAFTRWMDIILRLAGIGIVITMLVGNPIAVLPTGSVLASEPDLAGMFKYFVSGILVVIAAASGWDVIRTLYRMIKK
jgi:hypothetical protein